MGFLPMNELPELWSHIVAWVDHLEAQAREHGRELTPLESKLARIVGVTQLGEVRILSVPKIPPPAHARVKELAQQIYMLTSDTQGMTAMHGVIVRLGCTGNLGLLAHEFVHVKQYERLGKEGFLREYIQQIDERGYHDAPFELEAEAKAVEAVNRCAAFRPK